MKALEIQRKTLFIDKEDYQRIEDGGWSIYIANTGRDDYAMVFKPGRREYLHRFVMNAPEGVLVDHINFDTLNCCKSNLRFVTSQQNQIHQRLRVTSQSGYKGVSWHEQTQKWRVQLGFNKKVLSFGLFKDKVDAARKYNEVATQYYGEYAWLNPLEAA